MRIFRSFRRGLLACSLVLVAAGLVAADNWPHWRGPNNDGICTETGLPTQWGESKNIAWTLKLPGQSGATPAVWGDRLFLTSADRDDIDLMCISTDGKELWKQKLGSGDRAFMRGEGNNASPSPSTDGKHVWAYAGTGDLACFDFDGKEVWKFNVQDRYGKFRIMHGMHTTPLLDGDRLYMQLIHSGGAHVIALNKADGTEVWNVERKSDGTGENEHSYASPVMWRKGKDAYLVTHGNDYAVAHRLEDGSEIWRVGDLNPKGLNYRRDLRFVASPVASPDLIVVPSAKDHGVVGVRPDAEGLVMPGSKYELWRLPNHTPDVPSPLVYDGLVYLCRERDFLICLDAKTGAEQYNQRIHSSIYRASPMAADGMVYLTARDGTVTVVKAGPKFEAVAENKLPDEIAASPAVSGGRIYLRGFKTLYAIGTQGK
ncbi:MAG TPA: PQQ-binding-like beta-propeller repeat protein [Gemmataceae bacterium]|nr:PQQ-binding-like beta-propeller repeat protein [Gemmataceae bacterium]